MKTNSSSKTRHYTLTVDFEGLSVDGPHYRNSGWGSVIPIEYGRRKNPFWNPNPMDAA